MPKNWFVKEEGILEIETPQKSKLSVNAKIVMIVAIVTFAVALGFFTQSRPTHEFNVQFMGQDGKILASVVTYEVIMELGAEQAKICDGRSSEQGRVDHCEWPAKYGDKITVKVVLDYSVKFRLVSPLMHFSVKPGDTIDVYVEPKP